MFNLSSESFSLGIESCSDDITTVKAQMADSVLISHLCWVQNLDEWGTFVPQSEFQRSSISLLLSRFLPYLCLGWDCWALGFQERVQYSAGTSSCITAKTDHVMNIPAQTARGCHLAAHIGDADCQFQKFSILVSNGMHCEHGFRLFQHKVWDQTTWACCLPASNSRWCVGTNTGGNTGGDTGGDGRGDGRGATWGGLCWCCKPVFLEVPNCHFQLLHGQKKNKGWRNSYTDREKKRLIFYNPCWLVVHLGIKYKQTICASCPRSQTCHVCDKCVKVTALISFKEQTLTEYTIERSAVFFWACR